MANAITPIIVQNTFMNGLEFHVGNNAIPMNGIYRLFPVNWVDNKPLRLPLGTVLAHTKLEGTHH